jgi:hypothetical protein
MEALDPQLVNDVVEFCRSFSWARIRRFSAQETDGLVAMGDQRGFRSVK